MRLRRMGHPSIWIVETHVPGSDMGHPDLWPVRKSKYMVVFPGSHGNAMLKR
jgi:hypothetical protein